MNRNTVAAAGLAVALGLTTADISQAHHHTVPTPTHGHQQIAANDGHAGQATVGALTIKGAFARASAGPVKTGAAYLTIVNTGKTPDRLIAARADVSESVELHTHLMDNGVMRMREVELIEVPADAMVALEPGGDHVMFMGLKAPLKEGDMVPVTLVFEQAGEVQIVVPVGPVGAGSPGHGTGHGHGHGHGHGTGHGTGHGHGTN